MKQQFSPVSENELITDGEICRPRQHYTPNHYKYHGRPPIALRLRIQSVSRRERQSDSAGEIFVDGCLYLFTSSIVFLFAAELCFIDFRTMQILID